MTFSIDGTEIGPIVETASIVGSIVGMLIALLVVYLLVRPPRHIRERRRAERRAKLPRPIEDEGQAEAEDFRRVADRMERRLQVLERALADRIDRPAIGQSDEVEEQPILAPAEDGRDFRRTE